MIMLDKLDDIKQDFIIKKFTQLLVFNKDNNFEIDLKKPETKRQYILLIFRYTNTSSGLTYRNKDIYFTIKLDIDTLAILQFFVLFFGNNKDFIFLILGRATQNACVK